MGDRDYWNAMQLLSGMVSLKPGEKIMFSCPNQRDAKAAFDRAVSILQATDPEPPADSPDSVDSKGAS